MPNANVLRALVRIVPTQAEVTEAMGVSQQRVSAIGSGSVAELAILAGYIRALGGELKVIATSATHGAASPDQPPRRAGARRTHRCRF